MADITKGKSEVHRKETIDTGRFKAPRIRETTSTMGQREYTIPEAIPNIHTNASTKAAALRLRETAADRLVPILVPTLPGKNAVLRKKEPSTKGNKYSQDFYASILYSISYTNSSIFSQNCFFCQY